MSAPRMALSDGGAVRVLVAPSVGGGRAVSALRLVLSDGGAVRVLVAPSVDGGRPVSVPRVVLSDGDDGGGAVGGVFAAAGAAMTGAGR